MQTLVACGRSVVGQQIAIVDADARSRVAACQLGEVWASGPHIAHGYWGNPAATAETFHARIVGAARAELAANR